MQLRLDRTTMGVKTAYLIANRVYAMYVESRNCGPVEPEGFFEEWMYDNAGWCSEEFYNSTFSLFIKLLQVNSDETPRRRRG